MGRVSRDMTESAGEIHVLDYVLSHESNDYKRVGQGYRHKKDDSLAVSEKGWYCHRSGTGGTAALGYLVELKGYSRVDAVCMLLGERPVEAFSKTKSKQGKHTDTAKAQSSQAKKAAYSKPVLNPHPQSETVLPQQLAPLALPRRHKDNRRVIAYLQSRGIDKDLILDCINRGTLYESAVHHNCVFLGKDERGKTRFAAIRSTTGRFMQDAEGSVKAYGFVIPPTSAAHIIVESKLGNSDDNGNKVSSVAVFESPIEALSHQTLCKQGFIPPFDGWRLSLGGTSMLALEHFLEKHPGITSLCICTNNDEAGDKAAESIAELLDGKRGADAGESADRAVKQGIVSQRAPPFRGNDWNDALQAVQMIQRMENTQNQARHNYVPDL